MEEHEEESLVRETLEHQRGEFRIIKGESSRSSMNSEGRAQGGLTIIHLTHVELVPKINS